MVLKNVPVNTYFFPQTLMKNTKYISIEIVLFTTDSKKMKVLIWYSVFVSFAPNVIFHILRLLNISNLNVTCHTHTSRFFGGAFFSLSTICNWLCIKVIKREYIMTSFCSENSHLYSIDTHSLFTRRTFVDYCSIETWASLIAA